MKDFWEEIEKAEKLPLENWNNEFEAALKIATEHSEASMENLLIGAYRDSESTADSET